jgi:hypothetical protein
VKHFHEQLQRRPRCKLSYTVTWLSPQSAGLVTKAKRRGAHRKERAPPATGQAAVPSGLLDASLDCRLGMQSRSHRHTRRRTGENYSAFLVEEDGTMSSFFRLAAAIGQYRPSCPM